jgi:hypothetical protein
LRLSSKTAEEALIVARVAAVSAEGAKSLVEGTRQYDSRRPKLALATFERALTRTGRQPDILRRMVWASQDLRDLTAARRFG